MKINTVRNICAAISFLGICFSTYSAPDADQLSAAECIAMRQMRSFRYTNTANGEADRVGNFPVVVRMFAPTGEGNSNNLGDPSFERVQSTDVLRAYVNNGRTQGSTNLVDLITRMDFDRND